MAEQHYHHDHSYHDNCRDDCPGNHDASLDHIDNIVNHWTDHVRPRAHDYRVTVDYSAGRIYVHDHGTRNYHVESDDRANDDAAARNVIVNLLRPKLDGTSNDYLDAPDLPAGTVHVDIELAPGEYHVAVFDHGSWNVSVIHHDECLDVDSTVKLLRAFCADIASGTSGFVPPAIQSAANAWLAEHRG